MSHVTNAIHMADPAAHGLRTLAPGAQADRAVVASRGNVAEIDVELEAA